MGGNYSVGVDCQVLERINVGTPVLVQWLAVKELVKCSKIHSKSSKWVFGPEESIVCCDRW